MVSNKNNILMTPCSLISSACTCACAAERGAERYSYFYVGLHVFMCSSLVQLG